MTETMKVEALKLSPNFYCTKKGECERAYTCINPNDIFMICPYFVVMSTDRKLHEEVQRARAADGGNLGH